MSTLSSLTAAIVRRTPPLAAVPPLPFAIDGAPVAAVDDGADAPPRAAWIDDLRFFATCYAVGLVFFLVMLS